jgi:hypothetical protein
MIKSKIMGWTGHVAHMEDMRNAYKNLAGKPEGKILDDQFIDGRIILKFILNDRVE